MRSLSPGALLAIALALTMAAPAFPAAPVRKKTALKASTIITVSGPEIQDGVILIEDGIIKDVGKNTEIPWDAEVLEAKGRTVMPGFVLAYTSSGLESPNENVPEVPFLSTFDSIEPFTPFFEDSLRDGVVSMLILPGTNTLLGGTGTVVSPHGLTVEEMLVKRYVGLMISLQPSGSTNRMGHMQRFRRYVDDLKFDREELDRRKRDAEKEKKPFDEKLDPRKAPMVDLLNGKLKAFIYCAVAADVPNALEIVERYKISAVLVLGPDCYKAVDLIAKSKLPVILPPQLVTWETNEERNEEEMKVVPMIFHNAKVKFAFQTDTSAYGRRYLWYQAATSVKYGMSRSEALKSITLYPAQFIGVDDRFGSIDKGKEANLIFLTGDPLDSQSWVDKVMLAGKVVYEKDKDQRLKKLLEKPKEPTDQKESKPPEEKPKQEPEPEPTNQKLKGHPGRA